MFLRFTEAARGLMQSRLPVQNGGRISRARSKLRGLDDLLRDAWPGRVGPAGLGLESSSAAIAELERNLIIERVRRHAPRPARRPAHRPQARRDRPTAVLRDRACAHSLGQIAKAHRVSRTTVSRVLKAGQAA